MDLVLVEDGGGREDGHLEGGALVMDNRPVDAWSVEEVLVFRDFGLSCFAGSLEWRCGL